MKNNFKFSILAIDVSIHERINRSNLLVKTMKMFITTFTYSTSLCMVQYYIYLNIGFLPMYPQTNERKTSEKKIKLTSPKHSRNTSVRKIKFMSYHFHNLIFYHSG